MFSDCTGGVTLWLSIFVLYKILKPSDPTDNWANLITLLLLLPELIPALPLASAWT